MMRVKILKMYEDVAVPEYQTQGAAGMDVRAYLQDEDRPLRINAGETLIVPTGLKVGLPEGWECQVRARGGTALRGLQVANGPGTVDSDYRGEVGIILYNSKDYPQFIEHQERVAQLVFKEAPQVTLEVVGTLEDTERGEGAYNSTGTV